MPAPQHQCRQVIVRFGTGVQPITVGRPLNIRGPYRFCAVLAQAVGAAGVSIYIGGFKDKAIVEAHLLQGCQHLRSAPSQRLSLKMVHTFTQLTEDLLQSLQKALPLAFICSLSLC